MQLPRLLPLGVLFVAAVASLASAGCSTTRQLRAAESIPPTGKAEKTEKDGALDYSVAIKIAAPPATVWALLADAPAFTTWNSTIIKLDGKVALGEKIHLISKEAPDKTFDLAVSTFDAPTHMVWEDGGSMFLGVRNFTLLPDGGGTIFVMSETFSGGMLGMIKGSLPDFTKGFEAFAADLKKAAEPKSPAVAGKAPPWGILQG